MDTTFFPGQVFLSKATSALLIFSLLVSTFVIALPSPAYAATIFTDGFEAPTNLGNWSAGSAWSSNSSAHSGAKSAHVNGGNSSQTMEKTISTVGYSGGLTFSFWYKAEDLDTSPNFDKLEVFYSTNNGGSWTEISSMQIDDDNDDENWHQYTFSSFPGSANNNPVFKIRFDADLSNGNDKIWIDDVELSGTALPPPNIPPVAIPGIASTSEDTPVVITLVATDFNTDPLTYSIVAQPTNGSVSGSGDTYTYTPDADWSGVDIFTFKANDGTADSNTATVTVTVAAENDAPSGSDDTYSTDEDTTLVVSAPGVLANDSDIDSGSLTATLVSGPSNGTLTLNSDGSFEYTPDADWTGVDTFTYTADDGALSCSPVTVTIVVSNDADAPVAEIDAYSTDEDTALVVTAPGVLDNDVDVDGDPLTAILETGVANGTLTLNSDGSFEYTPDADFNGSDSFTYKANDGTFDSSVVTVAITVTPVNDAPTAIDSAHTTDEDVQLDVSAPGVLDGSNDVDGDPLTAVIDTNPVNGTLTLNSDGSFSYLPNSGFTGVDTFTFTATDGSLSSAVQTVTITVNAVVPPSGPCADGIDNDGDTLIDYPQDPGCTDASDTDEADPAPTPSGGGNGPVLGGGPLGGPIVPFVAPAGNGQVLGTTTEATVQTEPSVTECPAYLLEYIRRGSNNNPAEVTKLQEFLNDFEGAALEVTGEYNDATYNAVRAFQEKYFADVMGPWGAAQVTGYVYHTTKKKVNELYCKLEKTFPLSVEQEAEIARIRALNATLPAPAAPAPVFEEVGVEEADTTQTASAIESEAGKGIWGGITNFFRNLW